MGKNLSVSDLRSQALSLARIASRWDVFDAVRDGAKEKAGATKGDLAMEMRKAARSLRKAFAGPLEMVSLRIEHKHGTDVYLFDTEEAAFAQVVSFVEYWWRSYFDSQRIPKDRKEAVRLYFAAAEGQESYDIGRTELVFGASKPRTKKVN